MIDTNYGLVEKWEKKESGVLHEETLLMRACKAGAYGHKIQYESCEIYQAHFTYLCGRPNVDLYRKRPDLFIGKLLICLSPEWEDFIRAQPVLDSILLRRLMKPMCKASSKTLHALPTGCRLYLFDEDAFRVHPYGHGAVYSSFEAFAKHGSGAVVRYGDKIISSASSHLTFENEVELDVTTDAEYRGKGLADHCVAAMINDCAKRGLIVHWDAKNTPSMNMALSHGFVLQQEYAVYILKL